MPSTGRLVRGRRVAGRVRRPRAACLVACVTAALVGCDSPDPPVAAGAGVEADALVAALAARARTDGDAGAGDGSAAAPRARSADPGFRPEAPAESIELLAVLDEASGARRALVYRFDRVALRAGPEGATAEPTDAATADAESDGGSFAFEDVLRVEGALETIARDHSDTDPAAAEAPRPAPREAWRREAIERATLGLAAIGPDRVQVRDTVLTVRPADDARDGPCTLDYVLEDGRGTALRFGQTTCPSSGGGGSIALATSATLGVSGTLVLDGEPHEVDGRGWVRRAWGALPSPGGAVVFDRLLLTLDGAGRLEAARSKRRSGRGPRTSEGSLRPDGAAGAIELAGLDWRDDGEGDGGEPRWTVVAPEAGIDLVLEPLGVVPTVAARAAEEIGARPAPLAVRARGSHAGIGFVEIVPVGGAGGDS